jgi:hypothetical protein
VRVFQFGVFVLVVAFAYCGFVAMRLMRLPQSPITPPVPRLADVKTVKSDLCKLAEAERGYFNATGTYATENELRSNGNSSLPPGSRWPYHYLIEVPSQNEFMILAMSYGPLGKGPVAVVIYTRGPVCTLTPNMPRFTNQLDNPPQKWGDAAPTYECEICEH